MDVASLCPLPVGVVWWESPERSLTVIVKGTFALDREGDARLVARQEPLSLDRESAKGDTDELDYASDFVPHKARADVLLVGHAHSVVPLERIRARLMVDDLEIRFFAVAPAPATKIPLVSGHLEATEPSEGALSVGPRAPWAPERAVLGGAAWRDADRAPLSRRFDFSFFNAARPAQQIDEISAGASLTLEKLLPGVARRRVRLPGLRPRVFVNQPGAGLMGMGMRLGAPPGPHEITMRCDTLWIDTDRAICTLTWRGVHALSTADTEPAQLVVALASPETEATWAQIQERMHTAMTSTPIQAADLRAVGAAPRGAPDRAAPARSASTGSSSAGPASMGAASSRFPLGRTKSAPSAPAPVPPPPPPAPAFVRPVPVPPAYMGPVFAPPAPVGAAAVPPASVRSAAVPPAAVPPASVRSAAAPPASVRSEAAPPASVRPAPRASATLSDEPTISRRSPQQPDPGTISLSDEDISIDDGELTVALTAQELVDLDTSEITFAETDASFWHSSPLDPPTVEMALGALAGVAGPEGASTRDDPWLNEQTVSIGEGDPKESALPFRAASLSTLLASLESIPATEEGTMTFAGTASIDSLPFESPIPSRTGTASFESPAIPPRTSALPFTGEVSPPDTGTVTFESPAIPPRTSALPFVESTLPFAREASPSRTSALPFVESTLPFQAPSPPAGGDQAPSPPTGGGVGVRLVATSQTGELLLFPPSGPPAGAALPFQAAATPAAGSALPFQAAPSSRPGGGLPFLQAPIPASRTAPPLDPDASPHPSAALPFQAAPGPPAGAARTFQLAGSGLLAGSPPAGGSAQPFQAPVSPPADLATVRAQPAPEGMRWSPRPADIEVAPVVSVAPKKQAPVEALLPLETYAAVHAEIREGKDLSEVLERHGIEESVWHTNERRQAEAMALEAKQGRTKMALDLFNAMASAQSRAASSDEIELTLDEYAAVRIDVELAEDPAPVLAKRGLTAAVWQRLQQRWRQRSLVDAKVAQALRRKLAAARSAVSARASASGGAAAALNPR